MQNAVQRCRLGTRWCDAIAPRDMDIAKAVSSNTRYRVRETHYICALPAAVASHSPLHSIINQEPFAMADARCSAQALPATQLHSHNAQHAVAQVMVCATRMKHVQTVRCVRAMRARSNTRTACHCTAWPIDPSQP
ncbi:hypothetical protein PK69_18300 [Xanthomonas phaseoli pv. phaseoli]|uniref:Uncharacterized protein n=1 Tax=Xanthomonas campestris pv. phaseoli TaxID=317013 RepID=A0AB38E2P3_XANCH|nr:MULTISPECIES: hypothetical protein [Xanthomonas]ATS23264.1 hypothetical protein XppCFBP412P_19070 [Xanthomonas phaseoli pv. phaseoli]ATS26162.1 hypothetical protein XppCFBP6164P_12005 [Xanthomonas phaseoli pv. phaseoli]ATS30349.1 hypothetical protein XppCFBP6546P_11670 [Xanthomonas phaseoli pv. phaseoli]ATS34420.1 hypothetical protein XppCFBP6982P_11465 [Xanthomonas phaseoli pv. phaseoli]AZU11177.1 hypothetical protein AC609_00170 [Xanthomonas phaseoli pv. phaseoli]